MRTVLLSVTAALTIGIFAFTGRGQVALNDLTAILTNAANRRQEYVDTFKDLTAIETKTTELFDKNGKVENRRKVVSDLLIYKLQTNSAVMDEFRITREVDGKPVGKGEKRAIDLLESLSKSKNFEQERKRLRDENLKYTLKYYRWGITLQPVPAVIKEMQPAYGFFLGQRERLNGHDLIVLDYQSQGVSPSSSNLVRNFTDPRTGDRGRIWMDAEDFRVWRWESEKTVVDRDITSAVVYMRDEIEYVPSAFGIHVPKTVITSFFDKQESDKQSVRLTGRITYAYDEFKRFEVRTESEIQTPTH
jgi:hypothetical protein